MFVLVRNASKSMPAQIWSTSPVKDELIHFLNLAKENGVTRLHVISEKKLSAWTRTYQPDRRELEKIYG